MKVRLGSERLLESGHLDGKRVGIVCNPASVDGELRHIVDRFAADGRATLAAIFGPQHGFRSDVQDNMIETRHAHDEARRVPVYSLYSETREPTPDMLRDLDVLVVDLQDVGVRIYTYIYTLANGLRAARKHGLKVIVCDRPNPIGGAQVEGMVLVPGFESFVGMYPIPMRHGLTIGEIARLFNEHFGIGADLDVMTMEGWRRDMYFDGTGLRRLTGAHLGNPGGIGSLPFGPPSGFASSGDGSRVSFSSLGDITGQNPDLLPEVWLIDLNAPWTLTVTGKPATLVSWGTRAGTWTYDVIRGRVENLAALPTSIDLGPVVCLENDSPDTDTQCFEDTASPLPGRSFSYLARSFDGATDSDYGRSSSGKVRLPASGGCTP